MEYLLEDILKEGKSFAVKVISRMIKNGSEMLSDDSPEYIEKVSACIACPYFGEVYPAPRLKLHGCTICKCPVVTKAKTKVLMRPADKVGESLDAKEIITTRLVGGDFVPEVVRCSDKTNNRWAGIEKKYEPA